MRLAEFIKDCGKSLEALYPAPEASRMALLLCCGRLGVKSYTHVVEPSYEIAPESLAGLEADRARLLAGEPLQYVLGVAPFAGRDFRVAPGVLIPRPETEELVEKAAAWLRSAEAPSGPTGSISADRRLRVLDLCTGSGCIAWSLALDFPEAEVIGIDLSDDALAIARTQKFSGTAAPIFLKRDVLDAVPQMGEFDLIVSNPPYIMEKEKVEMRPNVLDWEPAMALFVPDYDPLVFYRAVARWASALLRRPSAPCAVPAASSLGIAPCSDLAASSLAIAPCSDLAASSLGIVEINETLGPETVEVFRAAGFSSVRLENDLSGRPRFVLFSF